MLELRGRKTGIVLSGGGAKGAYQIGMFRALEEAGLEKDGLILAGTSIGAMTALVYAAGDTELVRKFLHRLGDTFASRSGKDEKDAAGVMRDFWEDLLPDGVLLANRVPVIACCYNIDRGRPEYFLLNRYSPAEQRALVTASGSLPGVLPPVLFHGSRYLDGGVVPEGLTDPQPADKIPAGALKDAAIDLELISYLTLHDRVDRKTLNREAQVLELWPSKPLEDRPHAGTLDFAQEKLVRNETLGYHDTLQLLARAGETRS